MEIAYERRHLAIVAEPYDSVVRGLGEHEADAWQPKRIVSAAQAAHDNLGTRASLDDTRDIGRGIKDDGARSGLCGCR
jgi:hypothetical protein